MYKVVIHRNAAKFYSNAGNDLQARLNAAIESISKSPRYNIHTYKASF